MNIGNIFIGMAISIGVGTIVAVWLLCRYGDYLMGKYYMTDREIPGRKDGCGDETVPTSIDCETGTPDSPPQPSCSLSSSEVDAEEVLEESDHDDENSAWDPSWDDDDWTRNSGVSTGVLGIQRIASNCDLSGLSLEDAETQSKWKLRAFYQRQHCIENDNASNNEKVGLDSLLTCWLRKSMMMCPSNAQR